MNTLAEFLSVISIYSYISSKVHSSRFLKLSLVLAPLPSSSAVGNFLLFYFFSFFAGKPNIEVEILHFMFILFIAVRIIFGKF